MGLDGAWPQLVTPKRMLLVIAIGKGYHISLMLNYGGTGNLVYAKET